LQLKRLRWLSRQFSFRNVLFGFSLIVLAFVGLRLLPADVDASSRLVSAASTVEEDSPWSRLYDKATIEEIRNEMDALQNYLAEETKDYYAQQFQNGLYEILPIAPRADGMYGLEVGTELAYWQVLPSGGVAKITLPVEGFEHCYEVRERLSALMVVERDKLALEALAAQ
jgi:hypothetical protein